MEYGGEENNVGGSGWVGKLNVVRFHNYQEGSRILGKAW